MPNVQQEEDPSLERIEVELQRYALERDRNRPLRGCRLQTRDERCRDNLRGSVWLPLLRSSSGEWTMR